MNRLDMRGLLEHATRMSPIGNRLVLVQARSAPPWRGPLSSLPAQLEANARLAVADPAHVPAGLYAREALEAMGLWTQLSHRLAIADNVRGALALVARGEAPLGIVYATDARLSERVNVVAEFPASTHTPIRYQFAVVRNRLTPPVAALFERLTGAAALDVYAAHGFSIEQAEDTVRAQ